MIGWSKKRKRCPERDRTMTFDELILAILHENSGGVKMCHLVTELIVRVHKLSKQDKLVGDLKKLANGVVRFMTVAIDDKLEEMQVDGKIGLLNYSWPLDREIVRQKTFVYLPLKDE